MWREIDTWVIAGDVGLPAEPAPLSPAVVVALLENQRPTISAHRLASFPVTARGDEPLTTTLEQQLPRLRDALRPAMSPPVR